tara:strand:+ start:1989 stop:2507 length:519 start_codon:yes stop_codon:yes gene_type:complete
MNLRSNPFENISKNEKSPPIIFDAILKPYASLSSYGFLTFMLILITVSCSIGIAFAILGAWPVLGFFGLEIFIIYQAFKYNYRDSKRIENIKLTDNDIVIESVNYKGESRIFELQTYWIKVDYRLSKTTRCGELILRSHGKAIEIGRFLTTREKKSLAIRLERELKAIRKKN